MKIIGAVLLLTVAAVNAYGMYHVAAGDSGLVSCTTPTKFNVRGDFVTDQYGGRKVILNGSQPGIRYDLMYEGAAVWNSDFIGTGSGYAFPAVYNEGVYTVMATNFNEGGCTAVMNGSYVHTHIIVPQVQIVFGGGSFCEGGTGVTIKLSASENNVKYQLKKANGTPVRDPVDGCCGSALSWNNITEAGTYTVTAVSGTNSVAMSGSASVAIRSQPKYNVTGTGSFIVGQSDIPITLSGSQPGVKYQLLSEAPSYKIGLPQDGTGNSLQWHIPAASGHLLVQTTDNFGCVAEMNGRAIVSVTGFQIDQTVVDGLAFKYKYDDQRRMTARKIPGKDWEYRVYDDLDRLVLTQDGEQRKTNQWTFTKYDELNRPMAMGIKDTTAILTQAQMQDVVNDYYALASTTKPWRKYGERFVGATTPNNVHGYTNYSYPQVTTSGTLNPDKYLSITYYDNYTFSNDWTDVYGYSSDGLSATVANGTVYNQFTPENKSVKGQVTGTKVKVLDDGNTWLKSTVYYDDKYRTIQSVSDNIKGGIDRTSNLYDFVGKVLKTKTTHNIAGGTSQNIVRSMDYDHGGRPLKIYHSINGATPVLLSQSIYNELSQSIGKKLYSTDNGNTFKQSVDYLYNIRGWLNSINDVANPEPADLFSLNLNYNTPTANGGAAQYNGNISEILWRGPDAKTNSYGYSYDALNRLTEAKYYNAADVTKNGRFDEKILDVVSNKSGYDLNGNIQFLTRAGKTGLNAIGITTYGLMDNLSYGYQGNQLLMVSDNGSKTEGFVDGVPPSNTDYLSFDYGYDANGNMNLDRNKSITGIVTPTGNSNITYNHLNLPKKVIKSTGDYIIYTYDATGRKLRQLVYDANNVLKKKADYAGGFFYENDTLKFINHEEGRITMTGSQPEYQYHLKDHLGNVRVTFTTKDEQEQNTATVEAATLLAEQGKFLNIDRARRVRSPLFDHTYNNQPRPAEGAYAIRLSGTSSDGYTREKYGLAKSLSVMPGDKIQVEVYAKYVDLNSTSVDAAIRTLVTNIAANAAAPGTVADGTSYASNSASNFSYGGYLDKSSEPQAGPKAYLNYLVFDRDFNFIQAKSGYKRVTTNARENTSTIGDITTAEGSPHELLSSSIDITEAGFVYIYLSNEESSPVEVYFDDFKVTQVKSPVIASQDYYPFGLTFNSCLRENSTPNQYKFNGKEEQDELGLEWLDYGRRMYDPAIGRWNVVDPLAERRYWMTLYNFVQNNPINRFDPDGLTDYTLNKKTGEMKEVTYDDKDQQMANAESKTDRIVMTNRKGEIKYRKNGNARTAVGGVEKGILKDGINFQNHHNVVAVGGKGQATVAGVRDFALKLSNYVNKEVGGYYFANNGETSTSYVAFGPYNNNTDQQENSGLRLDLSRPDLLGKVHPTVDFHTHLSRFGDNDRLRPSSLNGTGGDVDHKGRQSQIDTSLKFIIITNPSSTDSQATEVPY